MQEYVDLTVFVLGWAALSLGVVCLIVPFLAVLDWAITRIVVYLRLYPVLMAFIWSRKKGAK